MYTSMLFILHTLYFFLFFFFNDTATTEIYTLSLHDALPIFIQEVLDAHGIGTSKFISKRGEWKEAGSKGSFRDRKSTRLNSSHSQISYAVFCLKKKKKNNNTVTIAIQ